MTTTASALATATAPHLFWITSRAAGIVALLLSSASVGIGLLMGGRLTKRRGPDMRVTHEALSLATMAAIAVHGITLVGDKYLHPGLAEIAIPFIGAYKTFWTSIGIIGGWGMILLGLGYYARTRIGVQRWRRWHRFTALAWALGLIHALGMGTDAGQLWFLAMTSIAVLPVLVLLAVRWLGARDGAGVGSVPAGAAR